MQLEYIQGLSWPGDRSRPNDDAFCHSGIIAAVFDGATGVGEPLLPADSDAAWIARRGAEGLIAHQALGARGALAATATDAEREFDRIRLRPPAARYELPLAAMMLVAPEAEGLLALWFGDCAALVKRPDSPVQLIGDAIDKRSREAARAARLAKEKGISPTRSSSRPEWREAFLPSLQAARNRVNTVEGSWAFSPDAACATHVQSLAFDAPEGSDILICSDGFLALSSDYGRYDSDGLMHAAATIGLHSLLQEIRAIEDGDADGRKFPRFKKSDDASALLLKVM